MKNNLKFIVLALLFFICSRSVFAADIFCTSDKTNIAQNKTFTVSVNIDTDGKYINNSEGTISFSKDLINVESISSNSSIFSVWVEKPKFSNKNGTITFNGGIPDPGYSGTRGNVINVVFKAVKKGTAKISFTSADIYANDGMGTDIISGKSGVSLNIIEPIINKEVAIKEPKIISTKKQKLDIVPPTNLSVIPSITNEDFVSLNISSEDVSSGVSKYKIIVDGDASIEVSSNGDPVNVVLGPNNPGSHGISVIAYDNAGNLSAKDITFEFPEIKVPQIVNYPETIKKGDPIKIEGISYPNTDVNIWLAYEDNIPKNYTIKTLSDGKFSFTTDFIDKSGMESFWVEAFRANNIKSKSSQKYYVVVDKSQIVKIGLFIIEILSIEIPVSVLLILLIYIIYFSYLKIKRMKKRILVDLENTENEGHKIFKILEEDASHEKRFLLLRRVLSFRVLLAKMYLLHHELFQQISIEVIFLLVLILFPLLV